MSRAAFACLGLSLLAGRSDAGLYNPAEPPPLPVRADGPAAPLPVGVDEFGLLSGPLAVELNRLSDVGDLNPLRKENPARKTVLDRIAALRADPAVRRDPARLAGLAADLLRTRQTDAAVNLLGPKSSERAADFRVLANLAHAHAVRGEWGEAVRRHESALLDAEFPADLAGATPEQRAWLRKLERTHYRRWLQVHRREAEGRVRPETEDVFPLFDARFVGDGGHYEPGKLAAAERAKLPADAVAVVQQLLLWHRDDARLYWLLAELYAADGQLRVADKMFDRCLDQGFQLSNRKVLMDHRAAVKAAVAALPKSVPTEEALIGPAPAGPDPAERAAAEAEFWRKVWTGGAILGAVAVAMLLFQVRAIRRRCGPAG